MPKGVYERVPGKYPYGPRNLSPEDDSKIAEMYVNEGMSLKEIGKIFGVPGKAIRKSLKRTETPFQKQRLVGEKNGFWKGGRIIDGDGYILVRSPNHPNANRCKYIREHRLVMEKALGRYLTKDEVVHHKNGKREDNSLENLVLFRNNGTHLGVELLGKVPKWTEEGLEKIASRSIPSMTGTVQCLRGTGVRGLRRRQIQKFLHETSDLQDSGLEAGLEIPPSYPRNQKKKHEMVLSSSNDQKLKK